MRNEPDHANDRDKQTTSTSRPSHNTNYCDDHQQENREIIYQCMIYISAPSVPIENTPTNPYIHTSKFLLIVSYIRSVVRE